MVTQFPTIPHRKFREQSALKHIACTNQRKYHYSDFALYLSFFLPVTVRNWISSHTSATISLIILVEGHSRHLLFNLFTQLSQSSRQYSCFIFGRYHVQIWVQRQAVLLTVWFLSVSLGSCWDSTLQQAETACYFFNSLSYSLFTICPIICVYTELFKHQQRNHM